MPDYNIFEHHEANIVKLEKEKIKLSKSIRAVINLKNDAIEDIEQIKSLLLLQNSTIRHCLPVIVRDMILEDLDHDTSLIQNRCDFICNDLRQLKTKIDERMSLVNKNNFIMNLLNYKLYEVQYNFSKRIKQLKEVKKQLESSDITPGNESRVAMKFVENEKKITDCEMTHEEQHRSIRTQMLEAQELYEKSLNVLDDTVDIMKKNFNSLLKLLEAHKHQTNGQSTLEESLEMTKIRELMNKCTEMQSNGWKAPPQDITDFTIGHGLKFTEEGLLVTEDGKEISYKEVVELKLFDDVKLVDLFKSEDITAIGGQGDVSLQQSKIESTSTTDEKMSSEDVSYLKECLGVPLTLALAEITSVQPRDPIHYLGHWLFKYRYNEEVAETQRIEINQLTEERERLAKERWKKFLEEEARAAVIDMIVRAEEEAIRNELRRLELEMQAAEEEYDEDFSNQQQQNDFY